MLRKGKPAVHDLVQGSTSYLRSNLGAFGWATLAVGAGTGVAFVAGHFLPRPDLALIFDLIMLLAVLLSAIRFGLWPSVYTSLLSFLVYNFFFTAPYYSLMVASYADLVTIVVFLLIAVTVGNLASRLQARTAELERKTEDLSAANAQIAQELEVARGLQQAILPQAFPRCREFTGYAIMRPARQLAGDFYDVLELPNGRLGVLVADVSDKGVPAAFFMGISRTVLHSVAREGQSPGNCLARANDVLCRTNPTDLFVTVFYGILDPRDGNFVYANGGHNPPLLVRRGANATTLLEGTGSLVLGVLEGIRYPERSVRLEPGDALLLYTDGVTEAQNATGEEFAEERLMRALHEVQGFDPEAMVAHVTAAVSAFTGGAPLGDDLTCLVLSYRCATVTTARLTAPC
jgi:serine phosphatase RsbU (regulator of sigma subunit)